MSSEEAKRAVNEGLTRRKIARQEAEKEARLEQYERDMITRCNAHCADAKDQKRLDDTVRLHEARRAAAEAARRAARAKEQETDEKAAHTFRLYCIAVIILFWLTTWTYFPGWAALTTACGLAVVVSAYLFRLYCPIENLHKTNTTQ